MSEIEVENTARAGGNAALALLLAVVLMAAVRGGLMDTGLGNVIEILLGGLVGLIVVGASLGIVVVLRRLTGAAPRRLANAVIAALLSLWFLQANSPGEIARTVLDPDEWEFPIAWPTGLDVPSLALVALAAGLIAGLATLVRQRAATRHPLYVALTAASVAGALAVVAFLAFDGRDPFESGFPDPADRSGTALAAPDPSQPGAYTVEALSYGAGENPRRPEFGRDRDLESRAVDASRLLPEWKGIKQRMRERYWGFTLDSAPLNGLVWAPAGEGPFPLVLIVHGNHGMEDYSDPGYAYLGELLASRGAIAVSVDQNYVNGSWSGDFRGKEMPARAWLLLEHLALWRDWNGSPSHRFEGRVDMDRIALVGHSRGGEAVSIAHAYNRLPYFPDDATVAFDFGFNIRSLVAIAQVDQRYHRRVEIGDVSFLALQGSYDSDEPAYHGLRQFNRISFGGADYHFKAGLYIHGANHGQFNTTWGRSDYSPPDSWLLNLAPLMPAADQQKIAQVYVSAFVEATLHDDLRYLELLRDPRAGADWLPDHAYVQQFADSTFRPLAGFDEDLDVRTGTEPGSGIEATGFSLWREEELRHRDERKQGTSAVVLGWGADDRPDYSISVPADYWAQGYSGEDFLTLAVSASTETPPDGDESDDSDGQDDEPAAPRLTIEAVHADGTLVRVDSRDFAALAPPLRVRYLKHEAENEKRYKAVWEPVLQVLDVPLSALAAGGNVDTIRRLRFGFGDMPPGVVIMDEIGVRRALPGTRR